MTLRARLQSETATRHAQLEALPFFAALQAGTLPAPSIVTLLRSLAIGHAVLERALADTADEQVSALAASVPPKLPLLMADLDALHVAHQPSLASPIQASLEFGAWLLTGARDPNTLAGVLYVLEGSQQGGLVLKQYYSRCLGVDEAHLSYFGCYGADTTSQAKAFATRLNALVLDESQTTTMVRSAVRCFEWVAQVCAGLYPYVETDLEFRVAGVNPEAGDHRMPQHPLEVALALRAGRAAWERFPYLRERFGDRGRRFTSSDSCWLVALAHMPVDTATAQLRWLRGVLASRGIPTVILETHLRAIEGALAAEVEDHIAMCARYKPFLSGLDAERRSHGDGTAVATLIASFEARLRACSGPAIDSAAALIGSAWLDERSGIPGAFAATLSWLGDPARFASDWVAAVNELAASLRRVGDGAC
ncbi:MAG: biliverdin-producing heme oxygenase [Vicinamibacterales bacterium]